MIMKLTKPAEILVGNAMEAFAEASKNVPDPTAEQAQLIITHIGNLTFKYVAHATGSIEMAHDAEQEFYRRVRVSTAPQAANSNG